MIFCSLYSGSSGNSIFISSENTKILIDAGLSGKTIEKGLKDIDENPKEIDGILITHEHSDHIKGVGIMSRRYDIPIYANKFTWESMLPLLGNISEHNIKVISDYEVSIKDMYIKGFSIPHDASSPMGYSVFCGDKKACVATDLGYFSNEVKENIKDANVVLLESNHDVEMLKFGPYPYTLKRRILGNLGHLSNEDCGNAVVDIMNEDHKTVILGHLSKTNNYPELAYKTVLNILDENKVIMDKDITVKMAKRDMPSGYTEY